MEQHNKIVLKKYEENLIAIGFTFFFSLDLIVVSQIL